MNVLPELNVTGDPLASPLLWTLIYAQMLMAAFDTIFHHEMTQRLAWREGAARELALHAVRGFLYVPVFLMLGWTLPSGNWAALLLVILIVELGVTMADFVEEDRSRLLPSSERLTHTLLCINYGGILAILVPSLLDRLATTDALILVDRGFASAAMSVAAAGALFFAVRDILAWRRQESTVISPPAPLVEPLPPRQHVLITGGTGFVGRRLIAALIDAGHAVTVLTRRPEAAATLGTPLRIVTDLRQIEDQTCFDAIVNLAGEPVAGGPWTATRRRRIIESRRDVGERLLDLIDRLRHKPRVLVSASAIGWYGVRDDTPLDETSSATDAFTHQVCEQSEAVAECARIAGVRVVALRIGLVLDPAGGMLASLLPVYELGGGGPIGTGRQWMSWISRDDLVRLIAHVIATPGLSGPVNATAPVPVRNAEFASTLAGLLLRPALFRVPAWPLEAILGDLAREVLTGGQRVLPRGALDSGFVFQDPLLQGALAKMLGISARRRSSDARRARIADAG